MSARGKRYDNVWAALAEPQVIVSILILYCLFHLLLRILLSPNYTLDESEQILFGQSLQWGYRFRHPPLITWLSWATLSATGQSRQAFFLLKYVLMFAGLLAYFQAGRIVLRDTKLAGLAVFGLLTTVAIGYLPHIDLMHTVLLTTMLAAYLWADARALTRGSWWDHVLLGLITGLGILSKYVFIVLPIAMSIGTLAVPRLRARLKPLPLIVAALIAASIVAPYAWWAWHNEYSLLALAETITKSPGPSLNLINWLKGSGALIVALLGFIVPLIPIFPLIYWRASKPLRVGEGDPQDRDWLAMYAVAMVAAAIIMWGAVFFVGTESFKPRWMHQVLMPLPIWLFLRVKIAGEGERADRIFYWLAAIFALAVFVARIAIYETGASHCNDCREYWPMRDYAQSFRRTGFLGGTIVAAPYDLAGNLRGVFPDARVLTPGYPPAVFGPPEEGQCLVVWHGSGEMPKVTRDYLLNTMHAKFGPNDLRGDMSALLIGTHRLETMSYLLMPACYAFEQRSNVGGAKT
jgi:4-amino-4-deoxy-L-arabinose transferase-like glycosyltransferase